LFFMWNISIYSITVVNNIQRNNCTHDHHTCKKVQPHVVLLNKLDETDLLKASNKKYEMP